MSSLLPSNSTGQEVALEAATARISDIPTPLRDLWNPDTCPDDKLAWLAWSFGVDEWSQDWSDDAKRDTIRQAIAVQRIKGSVASIRRVLANAGYGAAQIIEGGTKSAPMWALYSVFLERPISNPQAIQVRRLLNTTAPARCVLDEFNFTQANNLHNGKITRNGLYNRGSA